MTRLFRLLFWAAAVFAVTMALWPLATPVPTAGLGDKWQHMIAFFTLTVLAGLAYPHSRLRTIALAMILLGLAIEVAQWALPMLNREGSGLDWLADGAATLVGLVVVGAMRQFFGHRAAEPGTQ
ncbi:teicoplanin resistance protein VanZ [Croceibacterium ferulae]|uniref:teicoplanin resistance protein VanZ n=1 Tax=Croceibacterium ferulae TaxID=1854641 RepID=UPI000EB254A3|nr:teicoplanin resistance protein VanZ [Croceibacterium ferulae]